MIVDVSDHPFKARLAQRIRAAGMTVDEMLDAANDADPDGYSREALRAMYRGSRRFQYRGMAAMVEALDAPAAEFPELRLAYAQHLLDEVEQGLDQALMNLEMIDPDRKLDPDAGNPKLAPINRRRKAVEDATQKARALEQRRRTDRQ